MGRLRIPCRTYTWEYDFELGSVRYIHINLDKDPGIFGFDMQDFQSNLSWEYILVYS